MFSIQTGYECLIENFHEQEPVRQSPECSRILKKIGTNPPKLPDFSAFSIHTRVKSGYNRKMTENLH